MSIESQPNKVVVETPELEDLEAARDLINENETLKSNTRVLELLKNDFVTEDGRQLDPGNFLSAMLEFIEAENNTVSPEELNAEIERNIVVHSKASN